ncbi:cAMP-binding domain of CRP or a regulatory subunit of cAMP-dependent protein kinases [Rhodospirillales bacterium URHD0017]|nr:cAMP-binding domain of CRP or a regulatory subunit of cAMP-dependent protein kinases [Rhodospirillales bacterium URHD0017]
MTGWAHFALSNTAATLASVGTAIEVARNAFIYRQAERADEVFYVEAGLVKIDGASPEGKFAVVALLGGGSFFGESCLAGHTMRKTNASALLDSRVISIRKRTMVRLLRTDPHVSRYFTAHMIRRLARAEEDLMDLRVNSVERRLARALLVLASMDENGQAQSVLAVINQQTLAEIVGSTRPRISEMMSKFRRRGYISASGPLKIHSSLVSVLLRERT